MTNRAADNPKIPLIIECALQLLRDHGDRGLTMRQVAARAEMSLSNVQYYFKNKSELLKGMVDFYVVKCKTAFEDHWQALAPANARECVESLLAYSLSEPACKSEICTIFRELWAIASHNEEIEHYLVAYYKLYADILNDILAPHAASPEAAAQATALLLPYFEGYAPIGQALPLDRPQVARMLTDTVLSILEEK